MKDYRLSTIKWSENGSVASFECSHIGIAGTTPVFIKRTPTKRIDYPYKYEARVGIAIMGCVCDKESYKKSPFDDNWRDNYAGAKGYTLEATLRVLNREIKSLAEGLW